MELNVSSGIIFQFEPGDQYNRNLAANVHPPDWVNPVPQRRYNLVVVGGGTAGLVTAAGAAGLGARVALVEKSLMGGDCLNCACVPSKALIRSARAAAEMRSAYAYGIEPVEVRADFGQVMERMRRLARGIEREGRGPALPRRTRRRHLHRRGPLHRSGHGRGRRPDAAFRKACIATGARASAPPIPGLAQAGYLTNETFFSLTELPRRVAVIGAGPVGCELSQTLQRLGAEVTLLERESPYPVARRRRRRADSGGVDSARRSAAADQVTERRVECRGGDKVLTLTKACAAKPGRRDILGAGPRPT